MLVASDDVEERIDVLSGALATHARAFLEGRYLPPAIRERLREPSREAAEEPDEPSGQGPDGNLGGA